MKQMEFCLVTGNSLSEALQQLPGTLQQISNGNEFDICAMMCVPEMIVPAAGGLVNPGRQQPRYQVSIVIAVKYEAAEGLPGMEGAFNEKGLAAFKAFQKAAIDSGFNPWGQQT